VRRTTPSRWAIWARGDFELMLVRYAPDYRWETADELRPLGMRSVYEGHAGLREMAADMHEAWERMEVTPLEVIDAGNPVVVLGQVHVRGVQPAAPERSLPQGCVRRHCPGPCRA
jgi:ketosteroid isomerase-like protein